jgi:inorganic pyrophosphatase
MIPIRIDGEYKHLFLKRFRWHEWARLIEERGITIDRKIGSAHPVFADILYPINYGYLNHTISADGQEVDVFVGTVETGLAGVILTTDHRRQDRELKLLWDCSPQEIYLAHGFVNFDRSLLEGELILRYPMRVLWKKKRRD